MVGKEEDYRNGYRIEGRGGRENREEEASEWLFLPAPVGCSRWGTHTVQRWRELGPDAGTALPSPDLIQPPLQQPNEQ